jgi:hypothetical protein
LELVGIARHAASTRSGRPGRPCSPALPVVRAAAPISTGGNEARDIRVVLATLPGHAFVTEEKALRTVHLTRADAQRHAHHLQADGARAVMLGRHVVLRRDMPELKRIEVRRLVVMSEDAEPVRVSWGSDLSRTQISRRPGGPGLP